MTTTLDEFKTIHAIADRAVALYQRLGYLDDKNVRFARAGIAHEITTVHNEIVPLRLDEFLAADDSNFAHDIGGIHRHLDHGGYHRPAKLTGCFLPRFANMKSVKEFAKERRDAADAFSAKYGGEK